MNKNKIDRLNHEDRLELLYSINSSKLISKYEFDEELIQYIADFEIPTRRRLEGYIAFLDGYMQVVDPEKSSITLTEDIKDILDERLKRFSISKSI